MRFNPKNGTKLARNGLRPRYNAPDQQALVQQVTNERIYGGDEPTPTIPALRVNSPEELAARLKIAEAAMNAVENGELLRLTHDIKIDNTAKTKDGKPFLRRKMAYEDDKDVFKTGTTCTYMGQDREQAMTRPGEIRANYTHVILIKGGFYAVNNSSLTGCFECLLK